MALFHGKNSFLLNAGTMGEYLDVNNLPKMPRGIYDEDYIITAEHVQRPDILALKLYGSTALWWVFALRNPDIIKDPIRDFKAGTRIKLPSMESVKVVTGG
tara:strand:+ start:426 stop:728 length:303 start_codon:yes stop_codon:yes gene_type:complete